MVSARPGEDIVKEINRILSRQGNVQRAAVAKAR
jgi:hypothetical protein